ncbi:MAG: PAS domain S-box protein [Gracilimonas sp.]|nr:PAS domain S-box protein [Gracilimonas sp.]
MSRNILAITKSETVYKTVSKILSGTEIPLNEIRRGKSEQSFKANLAESSVDLIIIDLSDLEISGYEVIDRIKEFDPYVPLILIKEDFKLDEAVKLVKAGVTDLIEKKELNVRLVKSVEAIFCKKFEFEKHLKISDLNSDLEEILNNHIINSLPGIFFVIDKQGQIISVNNRFREIFEYKYGGDNHYTNFVSEEDFQVAVESFDITLQKSSDEVELYLKTKEGCERFHYLLSGITTTVNNEMILVGIGVDITDRKEVEKELLNEQSFIDKALDSLPGLFYVLDEDMNYIRVNQFFIEVLGYTWEEIQDMHPHDFYFEEDHERIDNAIKKAFEEGSVSISARVKTKCSEHSYFFLTGSYFCQDGKKFILGTGVDITEKKLAEEKVKESLIEKEILLKEVHHRVKNNLALVSGMMQLQAYQADEEIVYKYLNDNQSRIKSIALIHEQLYQHHDFTYVHLDEQAENLVKHISDSIDNGKDINTKLDLDELEVNINQAVPFTLILNEVIMNTYKHAFKDLDKGQITVTLSKVNGLISLVVQDNGVGFPKDIDLENPTTLGMTLIKTLSDQLHGTLQIEFDNNGSKISLEFEKNDSLRGASSALI